MCYPPGRIEKIDNDLYRDVVDGTHYRRRRTGERSDEQAAIGAQGSYEVLCLKRLAARVGGAGGPT